RGHLPPSSSCHGQWNPAATIAADNPTSAATPPPATPQNPAWTTPIDALYCVATSRRYYPISFIPGYCRPSDRAHWWPPSMGWRLTCCRQHTVYRSGFWGGFLHGSATYGAGLVLGWPLTAVVAGLVTLDAKAVAAAL